ncbi:hypothetical protein BKA83DRAFT_4124914 [Pisolithus microcarpus]|nr:hypothetical protein BKA83DRAFT_4124914 [Pisolithus microcarpus]
MSAAHLNILLELWAASLVKVGASPIFSLYKEMYQTINKTEVGNVEWQSFTVKYTGDPHKVVQNMLANPEFSKEMDYWPFCKYDTKHSTWQWQNFMSGDWAWCQADLDCLRSMFVPIILGSDKTIVSVATGQNDYYPLYLSVGNIHNNVHQGHCNGVILIAFLAMPKTCFLKKNSEMLAVIGAHDIYELITPHLLHQIIKGAFKDHLVKWELIASFITDSDASSIAAVAPFPGLWHFPQGCHFKQWTGDDSKVLMKVYLPAIEGHIPQEITTGVVTNFSLPQQHAMKHYKQLIQLFGALNGLCSLITKSKHVKAVKRPYQHTNKYHVLGQMLLINQHLDKLATSQVDFESQGMLEGMCLSTVLDQLANQWLSDEDKDELEDPLVSASIDESQEQNWAAMIIALADELHIPNLSELVRAFLVRQLYPDDNHDPTDIPHLECPGYEGRISIHNSASSTFYALSNLSGVGAPMWRQEGPHYGCAFVIMDPELEGMCGEAPDELTRMWMVHPSFTSNHQCNLAVIHVDTIFHAAHLIPLYGQDCVLREILPCHSYDTFYGFYVNKFADHHTF